MELSTFVPARLKIARELTGVSQGQLAGRVGLSAAAVSQFESGAARPSAASSSAPSEALGIPVEFLSQPLGDTHEGFFRSLRRTSVADRRRAHAIAHVAHDLARGATPNNTFPRSDVPSIPVGGLDATRPEIEAIAREVRRVMWMPVKVMEMRASVVRAWVDGDGPPSVTLGDPLTGGG